MTASNTVPFTTNLDVVIQVSWLIAAACMYVCMYV